jgi:polyisoprenoid-binding protein YceI
VCRYDRALCAPLRLPRPQAIGTLTITGVSKEIAAPVKLTYFKDKLGQRVPNVEGDPLVMRSTFSIKRSDFGINPSAA